MMAAKLYEIGFHHLRGKIKMKYQGFIIVAKYLNV